MGQSSGATLAHASTRTHIHIHKHMHTHTCTHAHKTNTTALDDASAMAHPCQDHIGPACQGTRIRTSGASIACLAWPGIKPSPVQPRAPPANRPNGSNPNPNPNPSLTRLYMHICAAFWTVPPHAAVQPSRCCTHTNTAAAFVLLPASSLATAWRCHRRGTCSPRRQHMRNTAKLEGAPKRPLGPSKLAPS